MNSWVSKTITVDGIESRLICYAHDTDSVYTQRMIQVFPDFGDHGKNGECDCHDLYTPTTYPTGIAWSKFRKELKV